MLLLPPRHGKSELASRRFPAWYLGQFPDRQFLSFSATSEFAADFGRDVRNIMASEDYAVLFPTRLAEDSQAKGRWHTTDNGIYYAVGVGGSVMGKGAHIALIDDPFASMQDAYSEATRERVWHWYTGTVYNRLMPGGAIIVINHRMHEDDLCGRLLEAEKAGGDRWEVVSMPAIDAQGGALWSESYPIEALRRIQVVTLPHDWSALYMQNPTPDEGTFFKRDWFARRYTTAPALQRIYITCDYAVLEGRGDWTCFTVFAVDEKDDVFVLDVRRMQTTADVWVETLLDLVTIHKPMMIIEPRDQINNAMGPIIAKRMNERQVYCHREQITESGRGKKDVRARSIQARAAMGKVVLPQQAPWLADFEAELFSFPSGRHDDMVDTLALLGIALDEITAPSVPEPEREIMPRDYRRNRQYDDSDWMLA